jgi:acetyl-CoA acetyltransferase family protein
MARKSPPKVAADREPVIVAGVRTPFLKSNGAFKDLMTHDLGRAAITGLLGKTGLDPALVELVVLGTVVHQPPTPNVAREAALGAGIPSTVPAYTVSLACISANVAMTNAADQIRLGEIDVAVVGGTDSLSDPPIRLSRPLRQALIKSQKAKGPKDWMAILGDLSPSDLAPDVPSPAEFSTGLTMGESCERMARRIGITRAEGDEFSVRSHVLADRAWKEGRYQDEVVPVEVPPQFDVVAKDDGPRGDSTSETLAKLRPAFDREFGSITAASSSFLTDGASAVLLMSRARAAELKLAAKAIVRDFVYAAGDPLEELLAGPALTIPTLLERSGLSVADIGVWEIHEAFAAQVLANLRIMQPKIGDIPLDKLNVWGGSLSLGHPFGATGGRLLTTAAHRLEVTGARYAVVSGCAAGGHGSAILLENPHQSA